MLAPIPVTWASPRLGAWTAFAAAAAAWALGALNEWGYLRSLHLPIVVVALATALPALMFGLAVLLFRAFARGGAALRAALALPAVWVAFELVQARTGSQGTFGSLAYTQAENLPLLQLVALFGIWGVTFAVLFFAGAAAVVLIGSISPRQRLGLLAVAAVTAAAVLGFGPRRLRQDVPPVQMAVGLAASDLPENVRTFPDTGLAYADDAVDLMVVPAWDFGQDGWLHARMAIVRGVEGGFGVIRSAKQGLLTVSDDRGRVQAERPSTDGSFPTLLAAAPTRHDRTLYGRVGDVFGWATLVVLAGLLVSLLRPGKRTACSWPIFVRRCSSGSSLPTSLFVGLAHSASQSRC